MILVTSYLWGVLGNANTWELICWSRLLKRWDFVRKQLRVAGCSWTYSDSEEPGLLGECYLGYSKKQQGEETSSPENIAQEAGIQSGGLGAVVELT